jgi:hypothetical protein
MVWRQEITPDREPGSAALTSREAGSGRLPLRDTGRRQNQLLHPIGVQGLLRPVTFPWAGHGGFFGCEGGTER